MWVDIWSEDEFLFYVQEDQVTGLKKQNIAAEHLSSTQPAAVKAKVAR